MSHQVKSLVMISQEVIAKHIEGLSDVGGVPYWLLKEPLKRATPQQLYRIERASPHLVPESDELWLSHCMCYSDLREAYRDGEYQDSRMWRQLYLKRYEEAARKRQLVSQKVKSQYSKIQSEKAARSIKVLKGVGPIRGRTYEESRTTGASKLFRDTKKATIKANAIFHSPIRRTTQSPSLFYPSESIRSHQPPSTLFAHTISQQPNRPNNTRPVSKPIVPPSAKSNIPIHNQPQQTKQRPVLQSPTSSNKLKRSPSQPNPSSSPPKRLAAIVNYDFFKEY
ncbi:RNA polymerase II transcription factor SIII subunit A-domain-containing protein [Phycomyces blakesleeanus]|uniref:RNA polymerase II transcription factor SIII subunit A-domain-containing protein n=1 Tax=Phycomyces blakesleeanus TaxID=4837 RepID=A0ABR3BGY2_PHYBL